MKQFGGFSLRAVKTFNGMEGAGFNATLLLNGKAVAEATDSGDGGMVWFRWSNQEAKERFGLLAGSFTWTLQDRTGTYDIGMLVSAMVDDYLNEKRLKRLCQTKTLYKLDGDAEEEWRVIKVKYNDEVMAYLKNRFGSGLVAVANLRWAK